MHTELEHSIFLEGKELFKAIKNEKESLFDKQYWLGRMMDWVMKDPSFKVDLFRFVDVLPVLSTKDQVAQHIQEYLLKKDREIPLLMNTALKAASFSLARGLAASAIRKNVSDMAEKFILGENLSHAHKSLAKLAQLGFSFTIDLLGEKTLSNQEADAYFARYCELIIELPKVLKSTPLKDPVNISIKVSALSPNLKEEDPIYSIKEAEQRVLPLLKLAKEHGVFVNFDLESFQSHEIICGLFNRVIMSPDFIDWPHLGIVVQAYLTSSEKHVHQLIALCRQRKAPLAVRLVKGAYWDYEVVKAEQLGYECPVFKLKAETDHNYEKLARVLLDHVDLIRPAFASHNIRSLSSAISYAKHKNIPVSSYEIQMLYGMAENERKALISRGHHVRIYVPLGDMLPGMSYLVRRLLENTSQMGFLKLSHHDQHNEDQLLAAPLINVQQPSNRPAQAFVNERFADFGKEIERTAFHQALAQISKTLPQNIPIMIANQRHHSEAKISTINPSDNQQTIAHLDLAGPQHAELAIKSSLEHWSKLSRLSLVERSDQLDKLAAIIREDRFLLAALICYEVGKTWAEADAEVAEAIDFCRYYALMARTEISTTTIGQIAGEENTLVYEPRGPSLIIAPWNFPLAILCGMSVAAYVAGNPIIMKPAEQASSIAFSLYERMIKAGFIAQCTHFLPGQGEIVGAYLVSHPDIANICFTGSMAVGHHIAQSASIVSPTQRQHKKLVLEMGGKNAIIIDDDADLDEAVMACIKSALFFAGQKCSAASRILVLSSIAEAFIERLVAATASLKVSSALEPSAFMGPVIDQEAYERLSAILERIARDPSLSILYQGKQLSGGYFIPPTIVSVNDSHHWIMQEELFGPILAIHQLTNLEQALAVANNTRYALSGALFSRSPANIARAKTEFRVGNLYINQKCTGANVHRQPFGGHHMSGTGIKAGGPHYLLNFVDMKVISENTMRRGFVPDCA